ncbi:DNA-binding transcriptional LysR family regulator [Novosphingobium kunmingense]|uniref:DNA-binding transcriptional LysR family regulator n=1 Tax=Novosphingobium kunmingense TaxID=1211806 RepID=A0A2N0H3G8_9SPHN|nr:LysR substrate-binding domain-containing protein [Novosphingobium kunmingense]PKB13483.1 DNA-binding transcriptional LysR family regulator [Novosphingobium kunmingense]
MQVWDLNLRHLSATAQIARLGTINAAAQAVALTQPAITQALARLEREIGLPLFERRFDGMTATRAADALIPRIEAAMGHIASPHVTMARLRALLALADAGSYAGASALTGLSLPSLHRAVNDLSLAMRRTLVQRRGKGVALTDAGASLARSFRLARVELETGLAELEALKGRETRRIAIGAMPLSRARILPAAVTRFLRRFPQVRIAIAEGSRAELVEPLRNGALDLMVGALREPLLEADLVQKPLFTDLPAVIGRKGHPLAAGPAGVSDLAAYPWTVPSKGAPLRDSFDRFFAVAGVEPPSVPIESGSVMMIRQILVDSDFLTMLSPDQLAVELEAGWLTRIADLPPELGRTIGVTTRASWRLTEVQREFMADLDAVAAEMG